MFDKLLFIISNIYYTYTVQPPLDAVRMIIIRAMQTPLSFPFRLVLCPNYDPPASSDKRNFKSPLLSLYDDLLIIRSLMTYSKLLFSTVCLIIYVQTRRILSTLRQFNV